MTTKNAKIFFESLFKEAPNLGKLLASLRECNQISQETFLTILLQEQMKKASSTLKCTFIFQAAKFASTMLRPLIQKGGVFIQKKQCRKMCADEICFKIQSRN